MKNNLKKISYIFLHLILILIKPGFTEEIRIDENYRSANRHSFVLEVHNDLFVQNDRHFTSGVVIGARFNQVPKILRTFLPDYEVDQFVATLSQDIYTPTDLSRSDVVKDDIPYAAHLYMTFTIVKNKEKISDYTSLRVGIIGPAAGSSILSRTTLA